MTALPDVLRSAACWPAALAASLLASVLAWRLGALSADGAVAAVAVGTVVAGAGGWRWAVLLVGFVAAASAASALPPRPQAPRRNARQVLANGLVAAVAAWLNGLQAVSAGPAFAAALSAAWADTWATEFGVRYGGRPRRLWDRKPLEPGASGGITAAGTAAGVVAAVCCGGLAGALGIAPAGWTATAGVAGMLLDSVVGGAVQAHYRCTACGRETELSRCGCGGRTRRVRGLRWVDNDATNLLATAASGALGLWWSLPGRLP
ncbi:MAG: DUF92 domain-containing protein [Armatimonadota bacterium]|nr:DUF92 domain-containing protein [Armatimonadota bacterium]